MRLVAATLIAIAFAPAAAAAAPGDLDPGFGGGAGWVRTLEVRTGEANYLPRGAEDVALQPDGKVVAAGELQDGRSSWYFGVFRYNADGSLDTSFGSGGWTAVDLGSFEHPRTVAVQPDGRIVVAGETDCETARCFAAMRFHPDGSIDTSFGAGGVVRHGFYLQAAWANDMAIDRHGRIVLAGSRLRGGDAQDSEVACVVRLRPDGRPDPSFSGDGVALIDHGYGNDSAEAVALQGGRIVIAGEGRDSAAGARFGVARLRADGRLDRSFGRRGHRLVAFGRDRLATAHAVAAAPGGGVVVAGSATVEGRPPQVAVARLGRGGALDRRFGRVRTSPGPFGGHALAVAAPTRRSVLVAGRAFADPSIDASDWALLRYGSRGGLDRAFGAAGIARADFGTGSDRATAVALAPDRAILAGSIYESLGLARFVTR